MAQIGVIGVETPSGTVELPVFQVGDSGSNVDETIRVETPSGVGFVPITNTSENPAFPYIQVETATGTKAFHNSATNFQELVVEDWETVSVSEYDGDTADFSIVNVGGSIDNALRHDEGVFTRQIWTNPDDNVVTNEPQPGDVIECVINVVVADSSLVEGIFQWGIENGTTNPDFNNGDCYQVGVDVDAGQFTHNGTTFGTAGLSEYYTFEIEWGTGGTQTVTVYDESDTQVGTNTDTGAGTSLTGGGIGFVGQNDGRVFWGDVKIIGEV